MKRAHKWITALMTFSLLSGFALGLLAHPVLFPRTRRPPRKPQEYVAKYVAKLDEHVGLSSAQKGQIRGLLEARFEKVRKTRSEAHQERIEQLKQWRREGRENIRKILTPEQLPKYEKMIEEDDKRRDERRRTRGGRPGRRRHRGPRGPGRDDRRSPAGAPDRPGAD